VYLTPRAGDDNNEGKGKYAKEIKGDDYLQLSSSVFLFFLLFYISPLFVSLILCLWLSLLATTYLKQQEINEIRFSIILSRDQANWTQKEERKWENNRSTLYR